MARALATLPALHGGVVGAILDETMGFVLPLIGEDETTGYHRFLELLSAARIRLLNATHRYAQPCTTDEMYDELDALDTDRYFNADQMHAFDER